MGTKEMLNIAVDSQSDDVPEEFMRSRRPQDKPLDEEHHSGSTISGRLQSTE